MAVKDGTDVQRVNVSALQDRLRRRAGRRSHLRPTGEMRAPERTAGVLNPMGIQERDTSPTTTAPSMSEKRKNPAMLDAVLTRMHPDLRGRMRPPRRPSSTPVAQYGLEVGRARNEHDEILVSLLDCLRHVGRQRGVCRAAGASCSPAVGLVASRKSPGGLAAGWRDQIHRVRLSALGPGTRAVSDGLGSGRAHQPGLARTGWERRAVSNPRGRAVVRC